MRPVNICVSPAAYLAAAAGILLLPLPMLGCAVLAAAWHEVSHCLALAFFRIPIQQIRIGLLGASIHVGLLLPWQELLCAAAGPLGSFCLAFAARRFPLLALFGFVQGLFNLLPLYPMDGGRILHACLSLWKERRDIF